MASLVHQRWCCDADNPFVGNVPRGENPTSRFRSRCWQGTMTTWPWPNRGGSPVCRAAVSFFTTPFCTASTGSTREQCRFIDWAGVRRAWYSSPATIGPPVLFRTPSGVAPSTRSIAVSSPANPRRRPAGSKCRLGRSRILNLVQWRARQRRESRLAPSIVYWNPAPPRACWSFGFGVDAPHQIRIHAAALGHPLVNDPLYGPGGRPASAALPSAIGYWLHALELGFAHPRTGEPQRVVCPPPPDLRIGGRGKRQNLRTH